MKINVFYISLLTSLENLFSPTTQKLSLTGEKIAFVPLSKNIFGINNMLIYVVCMVRRVCLYIINLARYGIVFCPARYYRIKHSKVFV